MDFSELNQEDWRAFWEIADHRAFPTVDSRMAIGGDGIMFTMAEWSFLRKIFQRKQRVKKSRRG